MKHGAGPRGRPQVKCRVERIGGEIKRCQADGAAHQDVGMPAEEIGQARNQPMCCESGEDGEIQHLRMFSRRHQPQCRGLETVQQTTHIEQIGAPGVGEHDTPPDTLEEQDAQPILEHANLSADGTLGHIQFGGSARKAS